MKLMLLGQEVFSLLLNFCIYLIMWQAVGKTTLLNALQGKKFDKSVNRSTNGVDIARVTLSRTRNQSFFSKKSTEKVECYVWDFG